MTDTAHYQMVKRAMAEPKAVNLSCNTGTQPQGKNFPTTSGVRMMIGVPTRDRQQLTYDKPTMLVLKVSSDGARFLRNGYI